MARESNLLTFAILGIVGYYAYHYLQAQSAGGSAGSQICMFPDKTTVAMPAGNACPFDASHGGQSTPCYPASFVGPLPPGGAYCGN